jgi:hypothetical protein
VTSRACTRLPPSPIGFARLWLRAANNSCVAARRARARLTSRLTGSAAGMTRAIRELLEQTRKEDE